MAAPPNRTFTLINSFDSLMTELVEVCIPNTKRDSFTYQCGDWHPAIGARVWVPFRAKTCLGVVIAPQEKTNLAASSLKIIAGLIDDKPFLSKSLLNLCLWVSQYYQSPLSEVITLALPKHYRDGKSPLTSPIDYYHLSVKSTANMELPLTLNREQDNAVMHITQHLNYNSRFLLHGVTGSGKTEIYLHVVAETLAKQRQVLVLVPEIGLTPQLVARFKARFSASLVTIHSNLNEHERQLAWHQANSGEAQLVIGTRTAIFTPMPNLGLIIIDEEHDSSLKQQEGVRYSARDTALMRAHKEKIPIILGSAKPSLES